MRFEWDDKKNIINIKKHHIDFSDAKEMFSYPMLTAIDKRKDYGEERWVGVGILKGLIAVVVYTENDIGLIRIISARKATTYENKKYKEAIQY